MMKGEKIWIEDSIENRCDILIKEYIKDENSIRELIRALENVKKYLSYKKVEEYKKMIERRKL